MIRKVLSGVGALTMILGGVLIAQSGVASAGGTPVTLSGEITCAVTGSMHFSPALVNGGTAADTISVKAKLTGCSGPGGSSGGVTLSSGKMKATASTTINNDCGAILNGSSLPDITGTVKWKGTGGKIEASTVDIHQASAVYDPNGDNGDGSINVSLPTTVTSGSYNGEGAAFSGLTSSKPGGPLDAKCGGAGLKGVAYGKPGGSVTGSVTINEVGS